MKNEVVTQAHFRTQDSEYMYNYIEAAKTLDLKTEVELKLSTSTIDKYIFSVLVLKPVYLDDIVVKSGTISGGTL